AEDGIRDDLVTGVQTCALPIYRRPRPVTLYLTEADVAALFEPADALPIIEACFRRLAAGEVQNQPRVRLPMNGGQLALMGATDLDRKSVVEGKSVVGAERRSA